MTTFIQIHALQTVPPSCINRDDTGSPKSALYGGVKRHRVSSQAWKRAIRREFKEHLSTEELGVRTLEVVGQIAEEIQRQSDLSSQEAQTAAETIFKDAGFKINEKHKKKVTEEGTEVSARATYLFFLSRSEIKKLAELGVAQHNGEKTTKKAIRAALQGDNAFDTSLFGRMLADAPEANVDAACQVMHALSTHAVTPEFDYFTAVDDLAPEDNAGAGMIGTVEFVSSTMYRYACINFDRLTLNIGNRDAALRCVEAFARAFVLSMPTGKENTFANRTRPDFVLAEITESQPTSLVNAFEQPVPTNGTIMTSSIDALSRYKTSLAAAYGETSKQSLRTCTVADLDSETVQRLDAFSETVKFDDLIERTIEGLK